MSATVTVRRDGRRWLVLPSYSVDVADSTGHLTFSGYGRAEAERLAITLPLIFADRPVGALAESLAVVLTSRRPRPGEKWTVRI